MRVSIIGSGVVGKATGIGLRERGHMPLFFDVNPAATEDLRRDGFLVADSAEDSVRNSDIVMVCVPTPTIEGDVSLKQIREASTRIGAALKAVDHYKVVVVRSTVIPGCTRNEVIPILESFSEKKAGSGFGVCVNPEFLRERSALADFLSPDRIVVGEFDFQSGNIVETLYRSFRKPIIRCRLEEAEITKHVSNAFLAAKISYFNEVFKICRKAGVNPDVVSLAASLDHRIGEYGTTGGRPFDGSCLPKDLDAFISFVKSLGDNPEILEAARQVNEELRNSKAVLEVAPNIKKELRREHV